MTSEATTPPTGSQASEDGRGLSDSQDGPTIGPSGPPLSPASPSAQPESLEAWATNGTFGPLFEGMSPSAALQSSLESRLRARLDGYGSPEYALTWKHWDMRSGLRILQRRASGRRTSANGSSGWPTPYANEDRAEKYTDETTARHMAQGRHVHLAQVVKTTHAGWQTPKTPPGGGQATRETPGGGLRKLEDQVLLAGWGTPTGNDGKDIPSGDANSRLKAQVHGWNSPRGTDGSNGGPNQAGGALSHDAALTPNAMEGGQTSRGGDRKGEMLTGGLIRTGSSAPTEKRGVLAPEFSRWLQAFPAGWGDYAPTGTA